MDQKSAKTAVASQERRVATLEKQLAEQRLRLDELRALAQQKFTQE